jgi:hypothetical protein
MRAFCWHLCKPFPSLRSCTAAISLAVLFTAAVNAGPFTFSGELTADDPVYSRALWFGVGDVALSEVGTAVHYDVHVFNSPGDLIATSIRVRATGVPVDSEISSPGLQAVPAGPQFDTYLSIYGIVFDPAQPLNNLGATNDDDELDPSNGTDSAIYNYFLTGGVNHVLVVSSFANGELGPYEIEIIATGTTPIPEPETYALFAGAGLIGFGVWRRRTRKA